MSGDILQRTSTLTLNIKHLDHIRCLADHIYSSLPSPGPTVAASQVPGLFREPFILSGYRPVRQDWRCYLLSVFQRHNESLNVWTHLLAGPVLLLRWRANVGALGYTLDAAFLPLSLFLVSACTSLFLSVAAHLLQSHSEHAHYFFFFMDYVGVAMYQYGSSLGHYFYTSEAAWRESCVGPLFLPGAAFFGWLSCAAYCFAKARYRRPYPLRRKICQVIPATLSYLLGISPVVHRLLTVSWTQEPAQPLLALQIASFLLCALFFSCPVPERFFPGRCDFVGQGHQIFHLFLSLCTVFQLEALFQDYARRRDAMVEVFGAGQLWWACVSFPALFVCCVLTALVTMRHMDKKLAEHQDDGSSRKPTNAYDVNRTTTDGAGGSNGLATTNTGGGNDPAFSTWRDHKGMPASTLERPKAYAN
ncbi:putative membrane progestin receptor beta [Scophthalmus maximus]|uniref:Putative membrane progestin receptor beta n=1 Tax=Scophthalmus maximus TaxID=52904 RepID=A0A2U9CSM3_SCOMX|nr:putative membrane progestin receptor beta [Scophthalmus maximus]